MPRDALRRQDVPARPHGSSFFKSQIQPVQRHAHRRFTASTAQTLVQFLDGCIRLRGDELAQSFQIDLTTRKPPIGSAEVDPDSRRRCLTRRAHAGLTAKSSAIVGGEDAIPQVLGIRRGHPWLLETCRKSRPSRS